jgi:hypothetical protein
MDYNGWVMMQDKKKDIGNVDRFDTDNICFHLLTNNLVFQHRLVPCIENEYRSLLLGNEVDTIMYIPMFSDLISFPDDDIELIIQEEKKEYSSDVFLGKPEDRPFKLIEAQWKKLRKGTYIPSCYVVGPKVLKVRGIQGMVNVIEVFGTKKVMDTMRGFILPD